MKHEFNRHEASSLLKREIEHLVQSYMKAYPVPYEINIESLEHDHELKCVISFPRETFLPINTECQCSHNDRCDNNCRNTFKE